MLFIELRFLFFFLAVFGVYWNLPWHRARKAWLLLASYGFYAAWDWRFLGLILTSTVIDWFAGKGVAASQDPGRRRAWLLLSLSANLGILGFFKYYNFFVDSAASLLAAIGLPAGEWTLSIILPVGISFYTLQTLSYTLDIYRGKLKPSDSPLDLALFVAFFPQLVAGPIVRAIQFLPQLESRRTFRDHVAARAALAVFLTGFVKKTCVSDSIAPYVDQVFSNPLAFDSASAWLAAALFHLQLYCDFSGYSDMAIGLAGLLGFQLPRNFDFPYFTRSVTQFWKHWHMTLGQWFANYLYFPLGGSRGSSLVTARNLSVVFLVSGLWHGASYTFLVWGLYHGAFLVLERVGFGAILKRAWTPLRHLYTLLVVNAGFVVFRADSLPQAGEMLGALVGFGAGDGIAHHVGILLRPDIVVVLCLAAISSVPVFPALGQALERSFAFLQRGAWVREFVAPLSLIALFVLVGMRLASSTHNPFIYFRF